MNVPAKFQHLATANAFVYLDCPGHCGDRETVPLAGWQTQSQVSPFPSNDLHVLVLHVANVSRADGQNCQRYRAQEPSFSEQRMRGDLSEVLK